MTWSKTEGFSIEALPRCSARTAKVFVLWQFGWKFLLCYCVFIKAFAKSVRHCLRKWSHLISWSKEKATADFFLLQWIQQLPEIFVQLSFSNRLFRELKRTITVLKKTATFFLGGGRAQKKHFLVSWFFSVSHKFWNESKRSEWVERSKMLLIY